ncbi:MAG: hypothetical protein AAGA69_10765, partial [Pseudomonadota bacterium]
RDVAGLYSSLRSELITTAYPLPEVDWALIEDDRDQSRRRGLFGIRARPAPQEPQPRQPSVVGNAAPGLEVNEQ